MNEYTILTRHHKSRFGTSHGFIVPLTRSGRTMEDAARKRFEELGHSEDNSEVSLLVLDNKDVQRSSAVEVYRFKRSKPRYETQTEASARVLKEIRDSASGFLSETEIAERMLAAVPKKIPGEITQVKPA